MNTCIYIPLKQALRATKTEKAHAPKLHRRNVFFEHRNLSARFVRSTKRPAQPTAFQASGSTTRAPITRGCVSQGCAKGWQRDKKHEKEKRELKTYDCDVNIVACCNRTGCSKRIAVHVLRAELFGVLSAPVYPFRYVLRIFFC